MRKTKKNQKNDNITFLDWILYYIETKKDYISKVTYVGYKRTQKTMGMFFHNLKLKNVTYIHIQNYFKYLKEIRNNKNTTIKYQSGLIYPALTEASKKGLIEKNPVDFLLPIKIEKHLPTFYNKQDIKKLFEKIKGHKAELAILIATYYGFRRSELLGLKWNSIDFFNKTIRVENKILIVNKEIISTNVLKTASSNRILPLLPEIENKLLSYKKYLESQKSILNQNFNNNFLEYVFVDKCGNLIRPSYVSQALRDIIKQNNLKKIRFHDLRHSCASLLLACGVSLKNIQEWLGHSNFKTTADVYSHLEFNAKIEAGKKISRALNFSNKKSIKTQNELKKEILILKKELKFKINQLKALKI